MYTFPSSYAKWNYAHVSFHFQGRKQETKQSVMRDMRKWEHVVKTGSANIFIRNMRNIINIGEQCITLLHVTLPVGKNKNYSRSYEFRQIICPLNKHSQNKQHFGKIF